MDKRKPEFDEQPVKWVEYQFTTCKKLLPLPPWHSRPGTHRGLHPRWTYADLPRIGDRTLITATKPVLRKK